MTYHLSKHETCIVMVGTCMYNCPTFFLFWECLDDMSYWTNLYRTVADNELHFFTISNLNYTVFASLAHITTISQKLFNVGSTFWCLNVGFVHKVPNIFSVDIVD